jgi:hypothetical protein
MPEPQPNPLDEMFRAGAKRKYERDGEIEIDEVAVVSCGSDPGAYVQAWVWVSNEAGIEPIRCAHCGTQGEHVEVQASVSGTPGLVCCEMENATPPYSCPKCGTPHSSTEFEDEGEGAEAGRTFRYCSEACKESH